MTTHMQKLEIRMIIVYVFNYSAHVAVIVAFDVNTVRNHALQLGSGGDNKYRSVLTGI